MFKSTQRPTRAAIEATFWGALSKQYNRFQECANAADAIETAMVRANIGKVTADDAMATINDVLGAHGVLALYVDGSPVALYANTGDTYTSTVLYDLATRCFELTSYGDWIEAQEASGRYRFE